MNRIDKEDILILLMKKINPETLQEKNSINRIVNELYDLNRTVILPLDEMETFLFRKRYGILDNGIPQTNEFISKQYNVAYTKLKKTLDLIMVKLIFRVKKIEKRVKIEKMSSIDREARKEEIAEVLVSALPLSTSCKNRLTKAFLFTIKDIMEWSLKELNTILGKKDFSELISYIHSLNVRFLDELTPEERKEIILNSDSSLVSPSSAYWIPGTESISVESLKEWGIEDIKTLYLNVFDLPKKEKLKAMQFLVETNLYSLAKEEESKKL